MAVFTSPGTGTGSPNDLLRLQAPAPPGPSWLVGTSAGPPSVAGLAPPVAFLPAAPPAAPPGPPVPPASPAPPALPPSLLIGVTPPHAASASMSAESPERLADIVDLLSSTTPEADNITAVRGTFRHCAPNA